MSSTTETSLPGWLTDPSKKALNQIENWLGSKNNYVYGTKKGESLFTPMSKQQQKAIGNVDWLSNQNLGKMFGLNKAENLWTKYGNAGPMNTEVKSIEGYMNPYTESVLNPTIRELQQESDRQANQIGASAAMSGAFGDARHGIAEGQNMEMTNQAVSDASQQAYRDAFDRALATRENALNRKMTDRNTAIERKGTAAQGIMGVGDNLFNKFNAVNDSLYNAGTQAYNFEEKRRQTMQSFQEALKNKQYDDALKMLAAVNGSPKESTTETSSNDGLFGLIGAALGGLF